MRNIIIMFTPVCLEIELKMDLMRVQQILINLLSNAIKFSPKDEIVKVKVDTKILED